MPEYIPFANENSMAWETTLDKLQGAFFGLAKVISVITICVTGAMVVLDNGSVNQMRVARLVLGITLLFNIGFFISDPEHSIFSSYVDYYTNTAKLKPDPLNIDLSDQDGINFIGHFVTYFERVCIYGAAQLVPLAFKLLFFLSFFQMANTLMFKLEGDHIQYLLHEIIKLGFYVWLIGNWMDGMMLANQIFTGFEKIGIIASGALGFVPTDVGGEQIIPQSIIGNAFKVVGHMFEQFKDYTFSLNIMSAVFQLAVTLITFLCLSLVSIELVLIRLTFWLCAMLSVILIPFGALSHTEFLFRRFIELTFNLCMKMAIMTFIALVTGPMMSGLVKNFCETKGFGNSFVSGLVVLIGSLCMYMLVKRGPEIIATFASGGTGGGLTRGDMTDSARDLGGKMATIPNAVGAAQGAIRTASTMEGGWATKESLEKEGKGEFSKWNKALGTGANLFHLGTAGIGNHIPGIGAYRRTQEGLRDNYIRNKEREARNENLLNTRRVKRKDDNGNEIEVDTAGWAYEQTSNESMNRTQTQKLEEISKKIEELTKKQNSSSENKVTEKV